VAVVASAALAALLVQPLATPSYAGTFCGTPAAFGDCTAPETTITGHPEVDEERRTESTDAAFTFESQDESTDDKSTFECKLEGPSQAHDWSACTDATQSKPGYSTGSKSYSGLGLGDYTFSVRATDTPDNPLDTANTETTPATFAWTIVEANEPPPPPDDDDAPQTRITSGATRWYPYSYLGITYASDEEGVHFRCTLNGEKRSCDDEQANFIGMKAGDYLFTVAAVDGAGNVDATPAKQRWTVPMDNSLFKTYSPQWDKRSGRGYFQDTYAITDARGAFIEQAKQGFKSLVLVATTCPGCGTVDVFLKDTLLRTVRLTSPEMQKRQVIPLASWRKRHAGRVRIVVTSDAKDVIVDGLGFSARR